MLKKSLIPAAYIFTLFACNQSASVVNTTANDTLTEEQMHLAPNALKELVLHKGLEVKVVATEPKLKNPTNIDVDDRGRIWVTEAFNYRPGNGNPLNPAGDRILILEDTTGDGVTDTAKVFYQAPEINAPLGVCVLGDRVLVSQSPYVWIFYDDNQDDKADRKEILFQGIGGEQHDHGMHTFTFGPDGKLYFNFGNEGKTLKDKNGKVIKDQDGDEIGPAKYKQGMVFRCNPDGSEVECLGNNFRNNFEVAVDSYGNMWQSDNDDDGNKGVRINYVMEYGNYGYTDEMTGAWWSEPRTNMEDSIPFRHWHLNDPGVIPNLLQTGSGSPTGMIVYEGNLLPDSFQNQMIHCDPGHNIVRSYPVTKSGAGFSAGILPVVYSDKDQWFRPSDICAAPDGSLIIADWYDAVVGGHDAKDQEKGRIYRVAPTSSAWKVPTFDFATAVGSVNALQNPNLSVRRRAYQSLVNMGSAAVPALEKLWNQKAEPRMRARSLWILAKLPDASRFIMQGIKDDNADIRIVSLRAARSIKMDVIPIIEQLVSDSDPQVRRECMLALRHNRSTKAPALWAALAAGYDGKDRWYLEGLGIAADRQWDSFWKAYTAAPGTSLETPQSKDIIWRSRSAVTLPLLAKLATDRSVPWKDRQRYFRAFDFNTSPQKPAFLIGLIQDNSDNDVPLNTLLLHHLRPADVKHSVVAQKALGSVLTAIYPGKAYLELVRQYHVVSEKPRLLALILKEPEDQRAAEAVRLYMEYGGESDFKKIVYGKDSTQAVAVLKAFGDVGYEQTLAVLQQVLLDKTMTGYLRDAAAHSLGRTYSGEYKVYDLVKAKKIDKSYIDAVMEGLNHGPRHSMYVKVEEVLNAGSKDNKPVFDKTAVLALQGNEANGKVVFAANCAVCHQIKNEGFDVGPKLGDIGGKLPKEGLIEAVTNPSGGISFGFEGWEFNMKNGSTLMGIISSKTPTDIDIKYPGGKTEKLHTADVKSMKQMQESVMPSFREVLSAQQLADLLEFLSKQKKK